MLEMYLLLIKKGYVVDRMIKKAESFIFFLMQKNSMTNIKNLGIVSIYNLNNIVKDYAKNVIIYDKNILKNYISITIL